MRAELDFRPVAYDEYQSGAIYTVPILLPVVVLPVAILAGRFLNGKRTPSEVDSAGPSSEELHPEKET